MADSLSEQLDRFVAAAIAGPVTSVSGVERGIARLAEIALDLRGMPRESFRNRLRGDLQRRATAMTATATSATVKPIREGLHTVTPYISVRDALGVIEFIKTAFGADGKIYGIGSQGGFHSEFKIGDSIIMIGGGGTWKGTEKPTALHYYVDDVDAVYRRALEAGAVSLSEPIEDHGERVAGVQDVGGNQWYIAKRLTGSHTDEGLRTVNPYLHPRGSLAFIEFLKRAFVAEEIAVYQSPDGIVQHAKIRIGDSVVEMGEAHGPWQPMPTAFYLSVEDADAWYARAVEGGAIATEAPTNQPYGARVGTVTDSQGNIWYIVTQIADVS